MKCCCGGREREARLGAAKTADEVSYRTIAGTVKSFQSSRCSDYMCLINDFCIVVGLVQGSQDRRHRGAVPHIYHIHTCYIELFSSFFSGGLPRHAPDTQNLGNACQPLMSASVPSALQCYFFAARTSVGSAEQQRVLMAISKTCGSATDY